MSQKPHYSDGEKVLCFHGPLLYEAKCLKSQMRDKTIKYFIHYSGWNKNWDEWVPECRVLKYNDVNLEKQKQLAQTLIPKSKKSKSSKSSSKKAVEKEKEKEEEVPDVPDKPVKQTKATKKETTAPPAQTISKPPEPKRAKLLEPKKAKSSEPKKAKPSEPKRAKPSEPKKAKPSEPKRAKLSEPKSAKPPESKSAKSPEMNRAKPPVERKFEEEPKTPVMIKLKIPDFLKCWLVDDMDLIGHQKKLLRLPARITVDHIIANYVKEKVSTNTLPAREELTIIRVTNRIRDCFNILLGTRLLHKFERPQYAEILAEHSDLRMCEIYGGNHLLRMFTTFGPLLTAMARGGRDLASVIYHIEDFIKYMGSNPVFFSLDDYVVASPEYQRRALA